MDGPVIVQATEEHGGRRRAVASSTPRPSGTVPPLFLPHILAMGCALLIGAIPDPRHALRLLAYLSIAYALWMVWSRGRTYLAPSGVYFLSSGVFIGLAIVYLLREGSVNELAALRDWSVVAFVTVVATGMVVTALSIRWRISWPSRTDQRLAPPPPAPAPPKLFQVTALLMVVFSRLPPVKGINIALADALGVCGVLMLVLAASSRRVRMRWFGDVALVALAFVVPLAWMAITFEGGGRLTLAGIGVACLTAWSLVRPRRIQKVLVVAAIPVFLVFAGLNRQANDGYRDTDSGDVIAEGDGLESMYSPLDTWVELVTIDDETLHYTRAADIGPRWGSTFLTTLVLPVPRSMWEDKPLGFGAELTRILRPTLLNQGRIAPEHSMAGLINSELYVNFGFVGLVLLPFLVGWFLAKLDQAHQRISRRGLLTVDDWWRATILVCLVSSLGDLLWVGTFTFFSRGGLAALFALVMWKLTTRADRSRAPAAG